MKLVAILVVGGYAIIILFFVIRYFTAKACQSCRYPMHRCACGSKCDHALQTPKRWTQDGWVSICLICREWTYHGDDDGTD